MARPRLYKYFHDIRAVNNAAKNNYNWDKDEQGRMGMQSIGELLGIENLQLLQDSFAKLTQTSAILLDMEGNNLTLPSNHRTTCPIMQGEALLKNCEDIHRKLYEEIYQTKKPAITTCPQSGLSIGIVPVFWKGEHVANWMLGQIRLAKTENAVDEIHACISPQTEYTELFSSLPVITPETLQDMFIFLQNLGRTIMNLTNANKEIQKASEDLRELAERLDLTAHMLTKFTNSADFAVYVCDFFTGELLMANEKYAHYVGIPVADLIGRNCWGSAADSILYEFSPHREARELLDEEGLPTAPLVWEGYIARHDIWLRITDQAIPWVDGRLAHMVTYIDITHTKQIHDQLEQLAFYDRDMQLPNPLKLSNDLHNMFADKQLSAICFDIVALRKINDAYSRDTGDALLRVVGNWVAELEQYRATLYRLEGDSFCLLTRNLSANEVELLAHRIKNRFEDPWQFNVDGEMLQIFCNISIGIINASENFVNIDDFLNLIERTLDYSRTHSEIAQYNEDLDRQFKNHIKLELSLKKCVKAGMKGFEVYYQPFVNPRTGKWCGLEALCRWNSPEFGFIPPLVFIAEAEQLGLICTIGRWVLDTAVRQCKQWGLDEHKDFLLDVNLSPTQLVEGQLVSNLVEILNKYDFPGEKLSLEITESMEFNFSEHNMNVIEQLRDLNVRMALDDFGTGYSSFNNLKKLPVSILKTERAFIMGLEDDAYLQYLLHVMIELAHAADMSLIAEGVETQRQAEILIKNGVDYMQGFLFSQPLSASELEKKLSNFYSSDSTLLFQQPQTLDQSKLHCTGYALTPVMYRRLHDCMQVLLSNGDLTECIEQALELLGEQLALSRSFIFLGDPLNGYTCMFEWQATELSFTSLLHTHFSFSNLPSSWKETFLNNSWIDLNNVRDCEDAVAHIFYQNEAKSALIMPILRNKELLGIICLYDSIYVRSWSPEEIMILRDLNMLVAIMYEKHKLFRNMQSHQQNMQTILHAIDAPLYIADKQSGRIVFANESFYSLFSPNEQIENQRCLALLWGEENDDWETFINHPAYRSRPREYYSRRLNMHLCVHGKDIQWEGRPAYMETLTLLPHKKNSPNKNSTSHIKSMK